MVKGEGNYFLNSKVLVLVLSCILLLSFYSSFVVADEDSNNCAEIGPARATYMTENSKLTAMKTVLRNCQRRFYADKKKDPNINEGSFICGLVSGSPSFDVKNIEYLNYGLNSSKSNCINSGSPILINTLITSLSLQNLKEQIKAQEQVVSSAQQVLNSKLSDLNKVSAGDFSLAETFSFGSENVKDWLQAWEKGEGIGGPDGVSVVFIKYLLLVLVFFLVFSSIGSFFENILVKTAVSLAFSFLVTLGINPTQIVSLFKSYSAAGISISIFFPIIVLGLITYNAVKKMRPEGLALQRFLWAAYSIFLFLDSAATFFNQQIVKMNFPFANFFSNIFASFGVGTQGDTTILFINMIISVSLFYFMVLKADSFMRKLAEMIRESDLAAKEDAIKRADADIKQRAEATRSE